MRIQSGLLVRICIGFDSWAPPTILRRVRIVTWSTSLPAEATADASADRSASQPCSITTLRRAAGRRGQVATLRCLRDEQP